MAMVRIKPPCIQCAKCRLVGRAGNHYCGNKRIPQHALYSRLNSCQSFVAKGEEAVAAWNKRNDGKGPGERSREVRRCTEIAAFMGDDGPASEELYAFADELKELAKQKEDTP